MSARNVQTGSISETIQWEKPSSNFEGISSQSVNSEKDDPDEENNPPSSGTLALGASCCSANVTYLQDVNLPNQAQEKAEKTVDELCEKAGKEGTQNVLQTHLKRLSSSIQK